MVLDMDTVREDGGVMTNKDIRITVADDQGMVLDTIIVTRDEFIHAQDSSLAALALLGELSIGTTQEEK